VVDLSPIRRILPRRLRGFYVAHRSTIGYVFLVVYVTAVGAWGFNRAEDDREAQCEALQVLVARQAANLDPKIVKSVFRPLRDADPEKFDAALDRSRMDLVRLQRVQTRLSCPPPKRPK
jgi:hypothetical protein